MGGFLLTGMHHATEQMHQCRGAVMLALWDAFQEHNIKIPYPQREVSVKERQP